MKKASKIVLTIGAVWNLLMTIGVFIAGLVISIVALVDKAMIDPAFYEEIEAIFAEMEVSIDADAIAWIVVGIYILIVLSIALVAGIFCLVATIL